VGTESARVKRADALAGILSPLPTLLRATSWRGEGGKRQICGREGDHKKSLGVAADPSTSGVQCLCAAASPVPGARNPPERIATPSSVAQHRGDLLSGIFFSIACPDSSGKKINEYLIDK